jgi:hypothetical protein
MSRLDVESAITSFSIACFASICAALRGFVRIVGIVSATCYCLVLQSTAALAVSTLNPVVINDCHISNTRSYVSSYKPIELVFTNRRATPADEIRFTVVYGGRAEHIIDRGTFSQNVRVDHAFSGFYNAPYRDSAPSCSIDYVEFRDGSVWMATVPSPAPKCPQS